MSKPTTAQQQLAASLAKAREMFLAAPKGVWDSPPARAFGYLEMAMQRKVTRLSPKGETYRSIRKKTGISQSHIGRILKGGAR